jgi:predicted transcriptional regulator of viral defense system
MKTKDFFNTHHVFRYEEFCSSVKHDGPEGANACRKLLSYHVKSGSLVSIRRLLYAYNYMGAKSQIDNYLIAGKATKDAVLAYHTALEIYGLAYTTFEENYYLTIASGRAFSFRGTRYQPVAQPIELVRQNKTNQETILIKRRGGQISVTSLERTIVDILARPDLCGGWEEVVRSLDNLASFDAEKLINYAISLGKGHVVARVGYFLDQLPNYLAINPQLMKTLLGHIAKSKTYMDKSLGKGIYIKKWNVIVPRFIAERQWEEPHNDDI